MEKLVIIGAGDFSREVAWLVDDINRITPHWELLGYVDEDKKKHGSILEGYKVLGGFEVFDNYSVGEFKVVCGVGNPVIKKKLITKAKERGVAFANLIHPSVINPPNISLGEGNIICAGNIISVGVKLGEHVIINLSCTIGHDVVIGNFSTLSPGVNVSGRVTFGEGCDVGTNSTFIQGLTVGDWTIIGAGAVVTKDLPPRCTAVGVPAKPIKFHD